MILIRSLVIVIVDVIGDNDNAMISIDGGGGHSVHYVQNFKILY